VLGKFVLSVVVAAIVAVLFRYPIGLVALFLMLAIIPLGMGRRDQTRN
jgi:hypothetical protein